MNRLDQTQTEDLAMAPSVCVARSFPRRHVAIRFVGFMGMLLASGCVATGHRWYEVDSAAVSQRAMETLKAAVRYPHNPVVRVEAVEALESGGQAAALPWIRAAMLDDHPAVRFAACTAAGKLKDHISTGALRARVDDDDASVRVAALFALHLLGHQGGTGRIPTYLLNHEDISVRRNAALLLGMLNEPGAIKILARGMKDADPGVREHALEGMARLGNAEAKQELTFMANSGVGSEEVFAVGALVGTGDQAYEDLFRYKLARASHVETQLAAAAGLGRLGHDTGYDLALRCLRKRRIVRRGANDPPDAQRLRARQLALAALGAIGRTDALASLGRLMDQARDPRIQVSAARAILEIVDKQKPDRNPFSAGSAFP